MRTRKLKNYFSEAPALAKLQPIIFATMLFNLGYGIFNIIISMIDLSYFIGITGIYSLIFGITKWYSLKRYNAILTQKIDNTDNEAENICAKNIAVCASVMSFLFFSFAFVSVFFYEDASDYSFYMVYFLGISSLIKILLAVIGSIKTRKNHSRIFFNLKLTDAANALISLGLAQRAILYYVGYEQVTLVGGISGIFSGVCALIICFFMIKKYIKESLRKRINSSGKRKTSIS